MFRYFRNLLGIRPKQRYYMDIDPENPTRTVPTDNYMNKLIKDDNNVSVGNFFLVTTTIVGILLLLIPLFTLTIEAWFNHTITTDLNGMAAYIIAVCSIFTVGGLTHGWTSWAKSKFENINKDSEGNQLVDNINLDGSDSSETNSDIEEI